MTDIEFDAAVDRDAANQPPYPVDRITVVWPDGTECAYEDLAEYLTFMSDDYEVVTLIESHIGYPSDRPFVSPIELSLEDDLPF